MESHLFLPCLIDHVVCNTSLWLHKKFRVGELISSLQEIIARIQAAETHGTSHKCRVERWRPQGGKMLTSLVSHTSCVFSFVTWSTPDHILLIPQSSVSRRICLFMFGTVCWFNREPEKFPSIALCTNAFLNHLITSRAPDYKIRTAEDMFLWS